MLPKEVEREGQTLFELDDDGCNRWWLTVQSTRLSTSDCAKIAKELADAWNRREAALSEVVGALRRISQAKSDRLDHSIDVAIIERAARIAGDALAAWDAAKDPGEGE